MNFLIARPRFILAIFFAIIAFVIVNNLSSYSFSRLEEGLICYNVFQWSYFISLILLIVKSSAEKVKTLAIRQDESSTFLITTCLLSSVITFTGIAFELSKAREVHTAIKLLHLALPAITLIGVWALIPTLFAVHYAHLYYLNKSEVKIIHFPDNPKEPTYWDFLYFSVTIAVASQTADISVTNSEGRKLVLAQSIFAFIFNTSVLALGINVAASLVN